MKIKQYEIWVADLNPRIKTETGKVRPVLIVQTDLLNKFHPTTLICPITSKIQNESEFLRVHLKKGVSGVNENCDIMIDQLRAIDNSRLRNKIGILSKDSIEKVKDNLKIILDLE
ncbi:MAG: type II toxin-antitoxin system PemK/MazF family toxin, partial [Bacteroidota bacterium]